MRSARPPKSADLIDAKRGDASKESADHSETSRGDPPSWATRTAPKGIARVPTHAARSAAEERRGAARAKLSLPIRVKRVAGQRERATQTLRTMNISSSGVLFLSPRRIEPGTPIELEVRLVDRPFGRGNVKMMTEAHIVRADPALREGWHALAATFDEITFQRDDPSPKWFGRE